ncbi:phage portal protein [Caulobacter sp. SL161]|uniref:Phage portal protein n=1 Tax=Caulobacter vibrioides TaxID=155892 RepID=A0A290MQ25_CAUVI|nr:MULTISPECIES: phage portal protein [Caulobacter]ATC34158.1 phage portal protein [Caulobacter vibrioides]MCY1649083.1 phage portal protein [Caulobacter sp. SL161]
MDRQLLGPTGSPLPQGIGAAVRAMANREGTDLSFNVGYKAGQTRGQDVGGWLPSQQSADASWLWSRDLAVARTRELMQNEPWAQGGVDRKLDMLVGAGWRPIIRPDAQALGITEEQAQTLGSQIESNYRLWGEDPLCRCDAEDTLTASWLLYLQVMEAEVTGDGVSVLRMRERPGWGFRTCVQVLDSDRLSNPNGVADDDHIRGGVEKDRYNAPIAYHFRNAHPGDVLGSTSKSMTWERVERNEPYGRPKVTHLFEKRRPGQSRGVSRLVAGLARFKGASRLTDNELANSTINSLFAGTIVSSFDPAVAQDHLMSSATAGYQDLRQKFYETADPRLAGARIQHLFPGDELKFLTTPRETVAFESFTTVFLRSIASSLGITYEQIAMDWSKVNYSSARAALIEVWRGIQRQRSMVAMMVATPWLLAVTEDGIDQGKIELPNGATWEDLYERPAAYLRGRWLGPARGWVDPVKEPAGAILQVEAGFNNWEDVAAEQGIDFDLNLAGLKRQKGMWHDAGLTPPALAAMMAMRGTSEDDKPNP